MPSRHADVPARLVLLEASGHRSRIECADPEMRLVFAANFAAMARVDDGTEVDLGFRIERGEPQTAIAVIEAGQDPIWVSDPCEALFVVESGIKLALQHRRPDLFFLHAATLAWNDAAFVFAAESGGGKSTTAWALLHHGFGYLSDELCPIDLERLHAHAYPHALCLKHTQAPPYLLPDGAIDLGRTIHVPAQLLPGPVIDEPRPIAALVLLEHGPDLAAPELRRLGTAEAAARLYINALNALAHPDRGLAAAIRLAECLPCYAVLSAGLPATCALIRNELQTAG